MELQAWTKSKAIETSDTANVVWVVYASNGYGEDTNIDSVWDTHAGAEARTAELNAQVAGPHARKPGERTTWADLDEYEIQS